MFKTEIKNSNRMMEEINRIREIMMMSAEKTGYTSKDTIHYSQELDKLIYEYQCTFRYEQKELKSVNKSFHQILIWPKTSLKSDIVFI